MKSFLGLLCALIIHSSLLQGEESFLLINGNTSEIIQEFGSHVHKRATPASTFKIALSLIGFDAGILENETMPVWDFHEGYDDFLQIWRSSQNPQTWMASSCIWFSKVLTLKIGLEKLQRYLASFNYGNQDFSSGLVEPGPLNPAWVSSSLKISPKEQAEWIQKMVLNQLPVSNKAVEMTRAILLHEQLVEGWQLYGKTGLGTSLHGERIRWFVGWVEGEENFFPFAYQERDREIDVNQAVPRVKKLLESLDIKRGFQKL